MLNGITSPSELMNEAIASSNNNNNGKASASIPSLQQNNNINSTNQVHVEQKNVTFNFSGIQLAVPYKISVFSEVTADPAGAEKHAKLLIDETFTNIAKNIFSNFEKDSEIGKINRNFGSASNNNDNAVYSLSDLLENLLVETQEAARGTNNIFNPVVIAGDGDGDDSKIITWDDAFSLTTDEDKSGGSPLLTKKISEAQLDLCAIAKGWIVDSICCKLISCGFTGAFVDWGGDVKGQGRNTASNTNEWNIGLEKAPLPSASPTPSPQQIATTITLCDSACATSGNYKQPGGKEHLRIIIPSHQAEKDSSKIKIASVTVVHPSASTADALATYYFCYLTQFLMSTTNSSSVSFLESEIAKSCEARTNNIACYGQEMTHVIVQYFDEKNEYRVFEWKQKRRQNNNNNNSSSSSALSENIIIKEVQLKDYSVSMNRNPTKYQQDHEVTDTLRRSLQRACAIIFVRIDHTFILGCTLSSGSLISCDYQASGNNHNKHKQSTTTTTIPSLAIFLFSVMRNSRLFNLLSFASTPPECWLLIPRCASSSSSVSISPSPHVISILSDFASGKMITLAELLRITQNNNNGENDNKNPTIMLCSNCKLQSQNNLACGDHGVFMLEHVLPSSAPELSLYFNPTISTSPILRSGRNYVAPSPSMSATTVPIASAFPKLIASKSLFQQLLNFSSPTTCGIFTRMSKGQFFGITCSNIEFISSSATTTTATSPVLQIVCPLNDLSMAALGDVFTPSSKNDNNQKFRLRLHIFGQHPDVESLLKWFADPSFLSGGRSEHFMYLPSASDAEGAEKYAFPGTAGRGAGAIYILNCDIVFVDRIAANSALLILAQVDFSNFDHSNNNNSSNNVKSFVNPASKEYHYMKPTLWWS